jgi:outer membrane murein-binding lipoprotein Lpp
MQTSHPASLRRPFARGALNLAALTLATSFVLAGCTATEPPLLTGQVTDLQTDVDALREALAAAQRDLASRDAASSAAAASMSQELTGINARLDTLPADVAKLCPDVPAAPPEPQACEPTVEVRTVTVSSDKLVVGEVERVLLEPPGGHIVARIDTGAGSSSLHAEQMVEFERDGDRWVRFDLKLDNGVSTIERPIERFVRVVQQADPKGSRRPVVELQVRLGNVRETIEFTLADRSHMDNEMMLGRNFLTDVALVDVGKQFIQPPIQDDAQGSPPAQAQ